jgi:predicted ATPase
MQLKRLYIKEYKLFKDFTYEFPADSKHLVNVLIGINGSGKSTILEAIAEIFSCVVLGEKAKFGFELEYSFKQNFVDFPADYKGFIPHPLDIIITGEYDQKPELLLMPEGPEVFYKIPSFSKFQDYIPKSIVIYYSGYSEIMKAICAPHNKIVSINLRKGIDSPIQFYYHEPKLFNIILLCLLSYEFGDVAKFLKQNAKIDGVTEIQIRIKKPHWAKTVVTIPDFWGSSGEVKTFLDFLLSKSDYINIVDIPVEENTDQPSIAINQIDNQFIVFTISGKKQLYEIRDFLIEEKNLFKILHTMYLDDLLDDIGFSLIKDEDGEKKTFSILSEGEQQSITIKGLTELLAGENTLFLFDEPDTFLHPKWQRSFISEIEENVELNHANEISYLIATHSPQILSNAKPDKTFVKIIEDGQLVEQTPKHYGRDLRSILYNLMDLEDRNEIARADLSRLYMLIEDEEIDEADELLKKLTDLLGDTDVDIQNATIQLSYLKDEKD